MTDRIYKRPHTGDRWEGSALGWRRQPPERVGPEELARALKMLEELTGFSPPVRQKAAKKQ